MKQPYHFILYLLLIFPFTLSAQEAAKPMVQESVEEQIKKLDYEYSLVTDLRSIYGLVYRCKQAADANPTSYELNWRAARALFLQSDVLYYQYQTENIRQAKAEDVGDVLSAESKLTKEQERMLFSLGKEIRVYAQKARELDKDKIEGYYYSALGVSMYALGKGIGAALLEGLAGKMEENFEACIRINKAYQQAGGLRVKGRYYYKLPWPKRSYSESEKALLEARAVAPACLRTQLFLGDTFYENDKKKEAQQAWAKVLASSAAATPTSDDRLIEKELKEIAKAKLEQINKEIKN